MRSEAGAGIGPVNAQERLDILDVLRGFALGGVFLANAITLFNGMDFLPPDPARTSTLSPLNQVLTGVFFTFVSQKFFTIFSILFGIGFSIQLMRADDRGAPIVRLYSRRLGALFLIGMTHALLIWHGDVLGSYALMGFPLLLFRRRKNRTVLLWAFLMGFVVQPIVGMIQRFGPLLHSSRDAAEAAAKIEMERHNQVFADALAGFASRSYADILRANLIVLREDVWTWSFLSVALALSLGNFLLGFYVGRRRVFHDPAQHRSFFRRLLVGGLITGVIAEGTRQTLRALLMKKAIDLGPSRVVLMPFLGHVSYLGIAGVYVSSITLLFQRPWWRKVLSVFAPAGRMALTNYLFQSIFGIIVYDGIGFGLVGKASMATCFGVTFALYGVELIWSRLWLRHFRFGPVEWLWRSMTYGEAQPMRIRAGAP